MGSSLKHCFVCLTIFAIGATILPSLYVASSNTSVNFRAGKNFLTPKISTAVQSSSTQLTTPAVRWLSTQPLTATTPAVRSSSIQPSTATTTKPQVSQGHAFIYSSYEEQTNGARNLWQLKMWAKLLNIKVAEPFAVDSMFGLKGAINISQALRFSDYFDIEKWNKMLVDYGASPLVKWESFLSTAPREAIIVYTVLKPVKKSPIVVSFDENDVKEQISPDDMLWLRAKFKVVRTLTYTCSTKMSHSVTLEKYNSYVFGDLDPSKVTLIFVNWIGISERVRVEIKVTPSTKSFISATKVTFNPPVKCSYVSPILLPSQRVLHAYETYVANYIGNRKYIGISFRTHYVMYRFRGSFDEKQKHVLQCSKELNHELNKIRNKWDIFLAIDLDTFGSQSDDYFDHTDKRFITIRDQIFQDVFDGSYSLEMEHRDERLLKAAGGIKDRGFIALLEKTIVTHADCIILLGMVSSFVTSSAMTYISLHNSTSMCVVSVCASKYYDPTGKIVSSAHIPEKFVKL